MVKKGYAQLAVQVATPKPAPAPSPQAEREKAARRVAVLVCHGMGQQVQFETLDAIARAVRETARECKTATADDVVVSLHPDGGKFIARAELPLRASGTVIDVHFYEAYWAPVTEGRVTLLETLAFFRDAGARGLRFAWRDGVFDRWMFGGRQEFEIPARRIVQLGLGLWMLLLLSAAFTAVGLLPVATFIEVLRNGQGNQELAGLAALAFSIAAFMLAFGIVAMLIARTLGPGADASRPNAVRDGPIGVMAPPKWRRNATLVLLVGIIALVSAIMGAFGWIMYTQWLLPSFADPSSHRVGILTAVTLYLMEIWILRKVVSGFLIQFAGDVAAYVSPFKVSKFEEIRREIQERGRRVARFIYSAVASDSNRPLYDDVFVVGHSLGSVLAYDTLNDSINRDTRAHGWETGSAPNVYNVLQRTKLLLTFGCPLDKTAFVFRTQKTHSETDVREALASAQQPLISGYSNRAGRWVNIWSPSDWISGPLGYYDTPPLGYYDTPQPLPGENVVCNIENVGSKKPWKAHTEYWEGAVVRGVLHAALTKICPGNVPEPQRTQILRGLGL